MIERIDIALLEQYKNGEIPADKVLRYDGTQVSDKELRIALEDFENLTIQLKAVDLGKSLKHIHEQVITNERKASKFRIWSVAAVFVLIASFSYLLLKPSQPEFSDYFNHFDQLMIFRGIDSLGVSDGIEAYDRKEYDIAYSKLEGITGLSYEGRYYLAISALGSNRSAEAITIFEELSEDDSNKYYQQIRWYLGLSFWQFKDEDAAINILNQISKGEYKYEESIKLIKALSDY
ncbi:tetratricopeptide repeat protein [Roseivirga sp.]|uniref:tetratricopeptide repeat protein n=1 Tax=Roseivirga sp. TaxID=1964215 RepID=UPI003B8D6B99